MENNLLLGQHFLINEKVLDELIKLSAITKTDNILEIGAGNGIVSKRIAPLCNHLDIVEIDTNLKKYLNDLPKVYKNVSIIYQNALNYNFSNYNKIITSLPYNILEPFLYKCIKYKVPYIVMLIGDKYALSLQNFGKTNSINFIQLLSKTFFNCHIGSFVDKNSFNPPPRTGSYIVKLEAKTIFSDLEFVVAEIFKQSDKKIKTSLKESLIRLYASKNNVLTQKQAKVIIENMNIDENVLNCFLSNLTNEQLCVLYNKIKAHMNI